MALLYHDGTIRVLLDVVVLVSLLAFAHAGIPEAVAFADATWNCDGHYAPCPKCNTVPVGSWQTPYGCAPYVAASISAGGYTPITNPCSDASAFTVTFEGKTYDLNVVSVLDKECDTPDGCLAEYLMARGWKKAEKISAGSVVVVNGETEDDEPCDYCHVVFGIGDNECNAHNMAEYHQTNCDQHYTINLILDPPDKPQNVCHKKSDGVYCENNMFYHCHNGKNGTLNECPFTCIESDVKGKSFCADVGSCVNTHETKKFYCGNDEIGASNYSNVLFHCRDHHPTGAVECPHGCNVHNATLDDKCSAKNITW